jgi:hypothetical protein
MTLITTEQHAQLLANGRAALDAKLANRRYDPRPVVRLYAPDGYANWLLTEVNPYDEDLAYGLCDFGCNYPKLNCVNIRELSTLAPRHLGPIERDLHFVAHRRISAYAAVARARGLIIT